MMKKSVILGVSLSLLIIISMALALALNSSAQKVFMLGDFSPSIKIIVDKKEDIFLIKDEQKYYDLFDILTKTLYENDGTLYKYDLRSMDILSIRRKYSDFETYVVDFDFSIERCFREINRYCDIINGEAEIEVLLEKHLFDDYFSILTIPVIDIKNTW